MTHFNQLDLLTFLKLKYLKLNFLKFKVAAFLSILLMASMIYPSTLLANVASPKTAGYVTALLNQHQALNKSLSNNQFKRPLVLNSTESPNQLKGEIYAVIDHPFATVNTALNNPANWCNALILHLNVKYCRAGSGEAGPELNLNLGKKYDQLLADTYPAAFNYRSITTSADYFLVELIAEEGPLGTRDYQISVEATPLQDNKTFLHFTYAYSFGFTGRVAMKGYLATIGRDKVGFTPTEPQPDNDTGYIQGVRGVVERNTMRYYLAIDAYLKGLNYPADKQFEKRLQLWFDSTEQYPRQLHEVEREEYFVTKRKEFKRQNTIE